MPFLAAPEPFSLELTTARFRAFGLDRATLWEDGALYRAAGGRELRIAAAPGGVDVEPLDAETEPVVRKLLGFEFDLVAFSAWAAGDELLGPLVVRFAGFRPTLAPDPFEMLVGAITAQQVSLFAAGAIRNRLVERFGEHVGRVWAFPTRERLAAASEEELCVVGFSRRKAEYVIALARSDLDLAALALLSDDEVKERLTALRGLGEWTADWSEYAITHFSCRSPERGNRLRRSVRRARQTQPRDRRHLHCLPVLREARRSGRERRGLCRRAGRRSGLRTDARLHRRQGWLLPSRLSS